MPALGTVINQGVNEPIQPNKPVEEIKNDSPAVKETLNPEDCAPGGTKRTPKKPTKSEKREQFKELSDDEYDDFMENYDPARDIFT